MNGEDMKNKDVIDADAIHPATASAGGYLFGMDKVQAVTALRALADAIETGKVLPQSLEYSQKISTADFAMRELTVSYAEKTG